MRKEKKGQKGAARAFLTRNAALRKLQLTLSEFRKLCVLKGVYPRDPRGRAPKGANKTYYFAKDIAFLAADPLVARLREFRTLKKKIRKAKGRREKGRIAALKAAYPRYTLEHIIRERYPTFADAVADLDDALTMVHLFAALPADIKVHVSRTSNCHRLAREWALWVVRAAALRSVFVSVKGYYFQAEVAGQKVTWMVPHAFTQKPSKQVDYRIMLAFLELHEELLGFVNFKLFNQIQLVYPPQLDPLSDRAGTELSALVARSTSITENLVQTHAERARAARIRQQQRIAAQKQRAAAAGAASSSSSSSSAAAAAAAAAAKAAAKASGNSSSSSDEDEDESESDSGSEIDFGSSGDSDGDSAEFDDSDSDEEDRADRLRELGEDEDAQLARIAELDNATLRRLEDEEDEEDEDADEGDGGDDEDGKEEEDTEGPHADFVAHMAEAQAKGDIGNLFTGLKFFLSREVPRPPLVLCIRALGGEVSWEVPAWDETVARLPEGAGNRQPFRGYFPSTDPSITHVITDRPRAPVDARLERTYVQPQWVFDSLNERFLLPPSEYAPGATLPPHLSPFVDNAAAGYVPRRRKQLDRIKAGLPAVDPAEAADAAARAAALGELSSSSDDDDEDSSDDDDDADGEKPGAGVLAPGEQLDRIKAQHAKKKRKNNKGRGGADSDDEDQADLRAEFAGESVDAAAAAARAAARRERQHARATQAANKAASDDHAARVGLLSKKDRRLYHKIKGAQNRYAEKGKRLERKRLAAEEKEVRQQARRVRS